MLLDWAWAEGGEAGVSARAVGGETQLARAELSLEELLVSVEVRKETAKLDTAPTAKATPCAKRGKATPPT